MKAYSLILVVSSLIKGILSEELCYPDDVCFGSRATTFNGDILEYSYSYQCRWIDNMWAKFAIYYSDLECTNVLYDDDVSFS